MKVLIADKFEKVGIDGLKDLGCTVVSEPEVKAEALPELMRKVDPHILIVRSKKVNADTLRAGAALTLVIRAGAGIDTIDVGAASDLGVFVSNCPGKNSIAVAELVMGLLLACDRRIPDQVAELRQGKWNKASYSKARGLYGRTLGIVGLGQIGREVALRARGLWNAGGGMVPKPHPRGGETGWGSPMPRRRWRWPGKPTRSPSTCRPTPRPRTWWMRSSSRP